MRILYVMPFSEPDIDSAKALRRYPLISELLREMRERGHAVRVLMHGTSRRSARVNDIVYESWSPSPIANALARALNARRPRYGRAYYELVPSMALRIRHLRPDIVHIFGLTLDLQLAMLLPAARLAGARTVVHYHGGLPATGRSLRLVQRWNGRLLDRVAVTARAHGDPWIDAGILRPNQLTAVVETSTTLRGMGRERARAITGMTGDPICLSAGRLHPIKDPHTMLRGFELFAAEKPAARLYLYYLTAEMLDELRETVSRSPLLRQRVEFRGRARADEMATVYSSADYLLQASVREWSGLAVIEAMACGVVPVISSIPAFEAMTGYGRCGALFPPGDAEGLAHALLAHEERGRDVAANEVREHFERELSFAAMARKFEATYDELLPTE